MVQSTASGYCTGHDSDAQQARCKVGMPTPGLRGMVSNYGRPLAPSVVASLASALERTVAGGEMEERLRGFEDLGARAPVGKASP